MLSIDAHGTATKQKPAAGATPKPRSSVPSPGTAASTPVRASSEEPDPAKPPAVAAASFISPSQPTPGFGDTLRRRAGSQPTPPSAGDDVFGGIAVEAGGGKDVRGAFDAYVLADFESEARMAREHTSSSELSCS